VPSKELVERSEVEWGASTVRAELATLEAAGYLTHPHTSAGRVPTELGYRRHVDLMMAAGEPSADAAVELEFSRLRQQIDTAMRETTTALAQVTDLMALVTAPLGGNALHARGSQAALRRAPRRPPSCRRADGRARGAGAVLGALARP